MTDKRPTIDDVARVSGVARTTVSRVLNNGPNVRATVRERVLEAVKSLGYQVNVQARFLAGGSSGLFAMIHAADPQTEPNSYYHSALEIGAMRACAVIGATLQTRAVDPRDPRSGDQILDMIVRLRCEGIVLSPPFSDRVELIRQIEEAGSPFVCVSSGIGKRLRAVSISIDEEEAGAALARHILSLGHRHVGYIDGPPEHIAAAQRLAGFRREVALAGLDQANIVVAQGNFTLRSGVEVAEALLHAHRSLTALVCANDDMAAGALLSAHRLGLAIPEQLAVTGFDDTPVSQVVWPPLTTVHQPIRAMGQRAIERLHDLLVNRTTAMVEGIDILPHHVVVRESTMGKQQVEGESTRSHAG